MANITVTFADGTPHTYNNVPDDVTPDQIEQRAASDFQGRKVISLDRQVSAEAKQVEQKPEQVDQLSDDPRIAFLQKIGRNDLVKKIVGTAVSAAEQQRDLSAGAVRGAGSIGTTLTTAGKVIRYPFHKLESLMIGDKEYGFDRIMDEDKSTREAIDAGLVEYTGANPESPAYKTGKVAAEIAGTAGTGALLEKGGAAVPLLANTNQGRLVLEALKTAGIGKGALPTRMAAGATVGGATGALIDPREAGTGAIVGGLLPPAIGVGGYVLSKLAAGGKYTANALDELLGGIEGKRRSAARVGLEMVGEKNLSKVEKLVREAPSSQTFAQASREASVPQIAAGEKFARGKLPQEFGDIADLSVAERQALLEKVNPGVKAAKEKVEKTSIPMLKEQYKSINDVEKAGQTLANRYFLREGVPILDKAGNPLTDAAGNVIYTGNKGAIQNAGRLYAEFGNQSNQAWKTAERPVGKLWTGQQKIARNIDQGVKNYEASADFADIARQRLKERDFAKYQLDSIQQHGLSRLTPKHVEASIKGVLSTPGKQASIVVQKSMKEISDNIAKWTDEATGTIKPENMHMIRKEMGNTVEKFAGEEKNFDKNLTAGIISDLQKSMDKSLNEATAGGWGKWLGVHSKLAKRVNQAEGIESLKYALKAADDSEAPLTYLAKIKAEGGDITANMTGRQKAAIEKVTKELKGLERDNELAAIGSKEFNRIISEQESIPMAPGLIDRVVAISNAVLRRAQGKGAYAVDKEFARLMLPENKVEFINLIKAAKPKERAVILAAAKKINEGSARVAPVLGAQESQRNEMKKGRLAEMAQ